jgi:hypothetical protein
MNAAVLGYGPAGLIAAKVLMDEGHDVEVIGAGGKSVIGGAQYLHENVMNPHNTKPEDYISFLKMGRRDVYAQKVYGDQTVDVSWDHYEGTVEAWSLLPVYDTLWTYFEDKLIHDTFNGISLAGLVNTERYDMVFSSIPQHALCLFPSHHTFPRVKIALVPWSPLKVPNTVLYSGRAADEWYRTSNIFGQQWSEFGGNFKAEYYDEIMSPDGDDDEREFLPITRGFKPMGTNCDCHPEVTRIGRFGLWDRKILLHHVPAQVRAALEARGERGVVSL